MSYGDEMVRLLGQASGDSLWFQEEEDLARNAGEWLGRHGWRFNDRMGFVSELVSFCADQHGDGIIVRRKINGMWEAEGVAYRVDSFREALNMLATKGLIDSRYATFGRDAMHDFARACEKAANDLEDIVAEWSSNADAKWAADKAEGLRAAAESARTFLPIKVPA